MDLKSSMSIKTSEATMGIGAMWRGSVAYFSTVHTPRSGDALEGHSNVFPWASGTMGNVVVGTPYPALATVTAAAGSKFDCTGWEHPVSTFERLGSLNQQFEVVGGSGIYVDQELE
jgi:hypothetical protein